MPSSFPPGVGLSYEYFPDIVAHIEQHDLSSWESLNRICSRTELYLATLARSRVQGGADILFAGSENGGLDRMVELLQVLRLGAKFHENQGDSFANNKLQEYLYHGAAIRITMLATMSDADYAQSPIAEFTQGHVFSGRTFPKISFAKLKPLAQDDWFKANFPHIISFLSSEFGPILPSLVRQAYKALNIGGAATIGQPQKSELS